MVRQVRTRDRAFEAAAQKFPDLTSVAKAYRCSTGFLYKTVYAQLEIERRRRLRSRHERAGQCEVSR
jgi:hypothetical protein